MKNKMKTWKEKGKRYVRTRAFPIHLLVFLALILLGYFIGYGYYVIVVIFCLLYVLSKQAENERIVSPKRKQRMQEELREMEEEAEFVRMHVEEYPEDGSENVASRYGKEIKDFKQDWELK